MRTRLLRMLPTCLLLCKPHPRTAFTSQGSLAMGWANAIALGGAGVPAEQACLVLIIILIIILAIGSRCSGLLVHTADRTGARSRGR